MNNRSESNPAQKSENESGDRRRKRMVQLVLERCKHETTSDDPPETAAVICSVDSRLSNLHSCWSNYLLENDRENDVWRLYEVTNGADLDEVVTYHLLSARPSKGVSQRRAAFTLLSEVLPYHPHFQYDHGCHKPIYETTITSFIRGVPDEVLEGIKRKSLWRSASKWVGDQSEKIYRSCCTSYPGFQTVRTNIQTGLSHSATSMNLRR